ncbi:MAG: cytochrome c-type biogenesis protein [Alphaproteobacteria bacterium]
MKQIGLGMILLGWSLLAGSGVAWAKFEVHSFDDPQKEQQYKHLVTELRCLVCQNQNLADSNAELAQDLRQEIYEMIQAGASEQEIVDFMVTRYGDFVLYRPPFKKSTAFLWIGPFLILAIGLLTLILFIRKYRRTAPPALDDAARARARKMLNDNDNDNDETPR